MTGGDVGAGADGGATAPVGAGGAAGPGTVADVGRGAPEESPVGGGTDPPAPATAVATSVVDVVAPGVDTTVVGGVPTAADGGVLDAAGAVMARNATTTPINVVLPAAQAARVTAAG